MTAEQEYQNLVEVLRWGRPRPALEEIGRIRKAAGRTVDDLVSDVFGEARTAEPGDACPQCGGRVVIRTSRRCGNSQVQVFRCGDCGWHPPRDRRIVPGRIIRRRRPSA
jgi:predicted RNA-binding Zn-ribbon protein involved in translation (DUF1610 family)